MGARTIAELAARERELMAELARVRVEISERAGQVDPDPADVEPEPEPTPEPEPEPEPEPAPVAKKTAAKK